MRNRNNPMRAQVFSLPALLKEQYEDLEPKTRKLLTTPEIFSIQRIILTGCGDSYAAPMAVKHVFEMLTGLPTEVVPAIELSRYYSEKQLGFAPYNPLVIAISNSGNVARVYEAVERVKKYGAFTVGFTGNPESRLGQAADRILKLDIPPFIDAPGTRSYLVSLLALLLTAVRIGEVKANYTMDTAMDYRYDFVRQGEKLSEMLEAMDETVWETAQQWKGYRIFDFVGCGFDYAAAWFGHAKILEAAGYPAMHINSEEWLHLNGFMAEPERIGTVVIANTTNPGISRTKEMLKAAESAGRKLMVITNGLPEQFGVDACYIKVPETAYQISMPLTQFVPMALLAGYLSEINGEKYGRGCEGAWKAWEGGACVRNSEIIVL